jgi:hypothetical protein
MEKQICYQKDQTQITEATTWRLEEISGFQAKFSAHGHEAACESYESPWQDCEEQQKFRLACN